MRKPISRVLQERLGVKKFGYLDIMYVNSCNNSGIWAVVSLIIGGLRNATQLTHTVSSLHFLSMISMPFQGRSQSHED